MLPEKVDKVARKRNALKKQQEEEECESALVQHDHSPKVREAAKTIFLSGPATKKRRGGWGVKVKVNSVPG